MTTRRTVTRLLVLMPVAACVHRYSPRPTKAPPIGAPPPPAFDAGAATEYPPNSAVRFPGHRVVVIRDDVGVMAVSAVCTHQGCIVVLSSDNNLTCNCHGSIFTMDGQVIAGPATRPLPHFMTSLVGERIYVDPSRPVAADDRLVI